MYRPGRINVADPLSRIPQSISFAAAVTTQPRVSTWAGHVFAVLSTRSRVGSRVSRGESTATSNPQAHPHDMEQMHPDDMEKVADMADQNFMERIKQGYRADPWFTPEVSAQFQSDNNAWWTSSHQLVVPDVSTLRSECIEAMHDHPYSGHFGQRKTLDLVRRVFYWPDMKEDVVKYCRACPSCQLNKARNTKPAGLLQPLDIPGRRWESISMDFIVELPLSKAGNDSILVIVDRLSKMTHLVACKTNISSPEVAELFIREVVRLQGWPTSIISDRDPRFVSEFWRHLHQTFGAKLCMSSAYHPQTDGQTERMNRTLEDVLRHYIGPFQSNWEELLPMAEFSINNSLSEVTGATPFLLNYGQHPDTPLTVVLRRRHLEVNRFIGQWTERIQQAKACILAAQSRQKLWADQKRRDDRFVVDDRVLLSVKHFRLPKGRSAKLSPRYVGPFRVSKVVSDTAYALELPELWRTTYSIFLLCNAG